MKGVFVNSLIIYFSFNLTLVASTSIEQFDFTKNIELYERINKLKSKQPFGPDKWMSSGERGSGGGGDIGICKNGKQNSIMSLDYILRDKNISISNMRDRSRTCLDNLDQIAESLKSISPKLAIGLNGFVKDFYSSLNADIMNKDRVFNFTNSPLIEINDEMFDTKALNSCSVKQAGIRLPLPGFIHYSINTKILNMLQRKPIQCSYFLVHEWLRDIFHEASKIRPIVHILHSNSFHAEPAILKKHLKIKSTFFDSIDDSYTTKEYFNDIRALGNLAYNETNLNDRLLKFKGKYTPANEKDCKKIVSVKERTISVSHLMSCDNPTSIEFKCNGFTCTKEMYHPSCDRFSLKVKLNGLYSNMEITGICNGRENNNRNLYVKDKYAKHFKNVLKMMDKK